jgi:PKD repeat protein
MWRTDNAARAQAVGWRVIRERSRACSSRYLLLLATFLLGTSVLAIDALPQWQQTLTVTESGLWSADIVFGVDPGATSGLDTALGEGELPPPPPLGTFDVRFSGSLLGNGSVVDLRSSAEPQVEHSLDLSFQRGASDTIAISWDVEALRAATTTAVLADPFGGILVSVDMHSTGLLEITEPSLSSMVLRFTSATDVIEPPQAQMLISPVSVAQDQEVLFEDNSIGAITGLQWDFGDGVTSTQTQGIHRYTTAGQFVVRLTVTGPGGMSSATDTVVVWAPPVAGFSATNDSVSTGDVVGFTDTSQGIVESWDWDFGDGARSNLRHATHAYGTSGSYLVSLTVVGPWGTTNAAAVIRVANRPPVITPAIDDFAVDEDQPLVLTLTNRESDDQDPAEDLTWAVEVLDGANLLARYDVSGGATDRFDFEPVANAAGVVRVRFTLRDDQGASDSQEAALTWRPLPDPPSVVNLVPADRATVTTAAGTVLSWQGQDVDEGESANLRYAVHVGRTTTPDSLLVADTAASTLVLGESDPGIYHWQVTATDPTGLSGSGPVWSIAVQGDTTVVTPAESASDFDGDGVVGFNDLFLFSDQFGIPQSSPDWDARYDLDGDGEVGYEDFFRFADDFGRSG